MAGNEIIKKLKKKIKLNMSSLLLTVFLKIKLTNKLSENCQEIQYCTIYELPKSMSSVQTLL